MKFTYRHWFCYSCDAFWPPSQCGWPGNSACLSVNSPALILSKNSGVSLAKIREKLAKLAKVGVPKGACFDQRSFPKFRLVIFVVSMVFVVPRNTLFLVSKRGLFSQKGLKWGRSNLVEPAEWAKIGLLDLCFGRVLLIFPRKSRKTQSSLNSLQSGPQKFTKSDFSGLAPIRPLPIFKISSHGSRGFEREKQTTPFLNNPFHRRVPFLHGW